jgi:hypothetical protein
MKKASFILNCLDESELIRNSLWRYVPARDDGQLRVRPIQRSRVGMFQGVLISGKVSFSGGLSFWGMLDGISLDSPRFSFHNKVLRLMLHNCEWFELAKYNDPEAIKASRGPAVLSEKLGLSLNEIFPISFDFRRQAQCENSLFVGSFEVSPSWGLTRSEVIDLIFIESKSIT